MGRANGCGLPDDDAEATVVSTGVGARVFGAESYYSQTTKREWRRECGYGTGATPWDAGSRRWRQRARWEARRGRGGLGGDGLRDAAGLLQSGSMVIVSAECGGSGSSSSNNSNNNRSSNRGTFRRWDAHKGGPEVLRC